MIISRNLAYAIYGMIRLQSNELKKELETRDTMGREYKTISQPDWTILDVEAPLLSTTVCYEVWSIADSSYKLLLSTVAAT